jgi:signal transduction histidine kinase
MTRLVEAAEESLGSLERSDREDELIGRLRRFGVERAAGPAGALAGLAAEVVDEVLAELESVSYAAAVVEAAVAAREVGALAAVALDAAGRISDIVGSVRSFSFLDQAPVQEVDLAAALDDTLVLLARKLGDIEVVRDYSEVPPFPAYGSELNQVWSNLIDNAADAIGDAGRDPGRIILRTKLEDDRVVVEVEDDGTGIPGDVVPRVFDSFFTTKAPGSGTGLGLDISYGIVVHRHGGDIDIETEPGRTIMRVALPVQGPDRVVAPAVPPE